MRPMSSSQHELGAGVSGDVQKRDEEEESRYVRYHEHRPQRETVHFAAEEGDIPRIKALVEAGILKGNSESVTLHLRELVLGMMPLHYAADHGRLETVEVRKSAEGKHGHVHACKSVHTCMQGYAHMHAGA